MERRIPAGIVNPKILIKFGLVSTAKNGIKILDSRDLRLSKKFEISGCAISTGAKAKIEAAGGKIS
jgi:ribosomal protein L15